MNRYLLLALLIACIIAPAAAWQDDYQDGTATAFFWDSLSYHSYSADIIPSGYLDTYALRLKIGLRTHNPGYGSTESGTIRIGEYGSPTNYFAFTPRAISYYDSGYSLSFRAFTSSGSTAATMDIKPYFTSANYGKRFEFVRENNNLRLYIDGVLTSTVPCTAQPYACGFTVSTYCADWENTYLTIDDFVCGASDSNVVGVIPQTWYVLKHPTDPTLSGLCNSAGETVYTTLMHVSYGVKTDPWGENYPPDGEYELRIYRVGSGYALNITPLNMSHAAGVIEYNLTELFFDNDDATPGWYSAKLYRGDTVLDQKWFAFINGGGTISFDAGSYVSSQTAKVTHSIPSFTIGEYIYEGQIIDIYGAE